MTEKKKGGFIKRLFGGNKEGCCGVQIQEIKEAPDKEEKVPDNPSGCCASDGKKGQ
jgi:hypothetical protein